MDGTQSVYSKNFSMIIDFFPQLLGEKGKPFQVKNKPIAIKILFKPSSGSNHTTTKYNMSKFMYSSTYINEKKLSLESNEMKLEF